MTKEKAIILNSVCATLEKEYFSLESKFEIPKGIIYATSKNLSKTKKIAEENTELNGTIEKVFKKEINFDENNKDKKYVDEVNEKYREYLKSDEVVEQRKAFLDEESGIDVYKVKKEALEGLIIPSAYLEIIEELLVE